MLIPKIGISEINLQNSTKLLSILLADEMTLYIKTRKFHWNIMGNSFMELHKLFEAQYSEFEAIIDEVVLGAEVFLAISNELKRRTKSML
jgi:starvation-inducible DNA-binding protein